MSKKILAIVLTAALMLSMAAIPAAAAEKQFSDTDGHWAASVIDQWAEYGVVQGDNGKFRPNSDMTRGEFATAMVNLLGLTKKSNYNPFTDLKGDEWYADAILKAYAAGILKGDESKRCKAGATVSREQAFVMAGRALGVEPEENPDLSKFKDGEKVSNWAKPMMAALVESGFVNGTSATTLEPTDEINRASVMQVLTNTVTTYVTKPGTYTAPGKGFVVVKAEKGEVTITGAANGVVVGQSSSGSTVNLDGIVVSGAVKVDAPEVTLNVKDSKVEGTVEVTPQAAGAELNVAAGSTLENVTTMADDVTVKGEGEVKSVEVAGGDQVEVATPGTAVKVDESAKDSTVTAGGETVKPGESSTTTGTPEGFVKPEPTPDTPSGGGTVTPTVPVSTMTIKDTTITSKVYDKNLSDIQVGVKVNVDASGTNATINGGALKYIAGWTGFGGDDASLNTGNYVVFDLVKPSITAPEDNTIVMKQYTNENKDAVKKTYTYAETFKDTAPCTYVWQVSGAGAKLYLGIDWDGDGDAYKEQLYIVSIGSDVVLSANAANTCTVTFNSDGGSTVASGSVTIGEKVTKPADPTKTGYTFEDWYTDAAYTTTFDFDTFIYKNITLYANWAAEPAIASEAKLSINTAADLYGKAASALMENVDLGDPTTANDHTTYQPSGKLLYVTGYTGFNGTVPAEQQGNYLAFNIQKPEAGITAPADDTPVLKFYGINSETDTVKKTFTYAELKNDDFFMVSRVVDNAKKIKFELDWDGTATKYSATTYIFDLSSMIFGTANTKLLEEVNNPITFVEETTPVESPYALMNIAYKRLADVDEVEVKATIPNGGSAKTVWKENYKNRTSGDGIFTWSMRDLSAGANGEGYTPTGSAATAYEQNNDYIIPVGTVITITISAKKAGDPDDSITMTHTVTEENIHEVWSGGWPTEGKQTSKANIDAALAALGTASFAGNLENNGYFEAQDGVTVTVTKPDANTTNFALSGSVTSGIPASTPYNTDFIPAQFDPEVAKNGYTAVTLAGVVEANQELTQTNPAFALYPSINWVGITGTGDNLVKTKTYSSAGDLDFLLIPGKNVTISVNGKTYTVENGLVFTNKPTFSDYTLHNSSAANLTAKQTAEMDTAVAGRKFVTVALTGTDVTSGLPNDTNEDDSIFDLFNGANVTFNDEFAVVTLPDFIPVGESTIVQVNSMLSYYTTDEFVTSNNGIYTKTKPYEKQAQDSYSFLLKAGDSVRITLTQDSESTEYTFVNHCAFAE